MPVGCSNGGGMLLQAAAAKSSGWLLGSARRIERCQLGYVPVQTVYLAQSQCLYPSSAVFIVVAVSISGGFCFNGRPCTGIFAGPCCANGVRHHVRSRRYAR